MKWINQRIMDRLPGHQHRVILLADRSSSMNTDSLTETDEALPEFRKAYPGLIAFGFHADLAQTEHDRYGLAWTHPDRANSKSGKKYRNCTFLGYCLDKIEHLRPAKTIVISDGGIADMERALRAADRITGDIDAYFCRSYCSEWQSMPFMKELARRGRGRFVAYEPGNIDMRGQLRESFITVRHEVRVHHHRLPDQHIYHGQPVSQRIGAQPARITITQGGQSRPVLPAPQNSDRYRIEDRREIPMQPVPNKVKKGWFW